MRSVYASYPDMKSTQRLIFIEDISGEEITCLIWTETNQFK